MLKNVKHMSKLHIWDVKSQNTLGHLMEKAMRCLSTCYVQD